VALGVAKRRTCDRILRLSHLDVTCVSYCESCERSAGDDRRDEKGTREDHPHY
jgi:hypothetical protein